MKPERMVAAVDRGWRSGSAAARGGLARLWMRVEAALPTIGTWALLLLGVAIYGSAVALAGIAVFRSYLPDWLMTWVRQVFLAGNTKVDLTLQLLNDWGLIDLLQNTVIGAVVFCVALFGLLILVHLIVLWSRNRRRKQRAEAAKALAMPRIRLKRPLTVTIADADSNVLLRYDIRVELVVEKASDIKPIIATLSNLKGLMAKAAEALIRVSFINVDPAAMADALSRTAKEATGRAVDRVEIGSILRLEIERATGRILSGAPQSPVPEYSAEDPEAGAAPSPGSRPKAASPSVHMPVRRRVPASPPSGPGAAIARVLPAEPAVASETSAQEPATAATERATVPPNPEPPPAIQPQPAGSEANLRAEDDIEVLEAPPTQPAQPTKPGLSVDMKKLKEVMSSLRS